MLALAFPALDPVALQIGPLPIRWYALAYIAGLCLAWLYALRLAGAARLWGDRPGVSLQAIEDALLWATLGVVMGGRLGHVLIYDPSYYSAHPGEIIQLWRGGMAFHGGLIGCALALLISARQHRVPALALLDLGAAAAPIGLFLGRLANFVNGELWGRASDLPWAVVFPHAGPLPRHPSQLYEAVIEGVLLFVLLRIAILRGALHRPGRVSGLFAIGYGLARIAVEFVREPDPELEQLAGGLTIGMMLSAAMAAAGHALLVRSGRQPPRREGRGGRLLLAGASLVLLSACSAATPIRYMTQGAIDPPSD